MLELSLSIAVAPAFKTALTAATIPLFDLSLDLGSDHPNLGSEIAFTNAPTLATTPVFTTALRFVVSRATGHGPSTRSVHGPFP